MSGPPEILLERVTALAGSAPVTWTHATGGYTITERWSLELEDGRRVFVKMAPTEGLAESLRMEHANLLGIGGRFRCGVVAWRDGDRPILILEDLAHAYWPPPWRDGDIDRVMRTLEEMWSTQPPPGMQDASRFRQMFSGWEDVARDPGSFLSLGVASRDWVGACVPTLIEAARAARLDGTDLLHLDVRSDNLCFDGDRVVLVDWNWASHGPRDLDLACWLPALRLEGGPLPEEIKPGLGSYAAGISAYFAANAPLPVPIGAPTVRKFQLRQLRISLPWACRELGLPEPDVPYARLEIAQLDEDRVRGMISETQWQERVEEVLIDAYLSYAEPWRQSGKSGDEAEWRWARELVLDVFPPRAAFLDVGCANGYLMESLHRWGRERGIGVEPYGLDISWRIATVARHRLPQWADRIYVGNVADWMPPRRFDVVQSGLDETAAHGQHEVVNRLLTDFLVPGGVLVFRPGRVGPGVPDHFEQLEALGLRPDGVIEAVHPVTGDIRRAAWLRAR